MKKAVLIYLFLLLYGKAIAQATIVAADRLNVAYEGIDNPLVVAVENCNCRDLSLTTDFGALRAGDDPCSYILHSNSPGKAHLTLKKKEGNTFREIGKVTYQIKEFPRPEASIMGRRSGTLKLAYLKVQRGILASVVNMDISARMRLRSYRVEVVRKGTLLFSAMNSGNQFEPRVKAFLDRVEVGDKVLFSDIQCIYFNGRSVELNSINLVID